MSEEYIPDFDLGEDFRSEARLLQDLEWSNSVVDGRKQLSNREAYIVHSDELIAAIINYHVVKMLCRQLNVSSSIFSKLQPEMIRLIVDYSLPGQGPLVSYFVRKYNNIVMGNNIQSKGKFPFRICARKRPLMTFERNNGCYDVMHAVHSVNECVLHDGRLGRHGRRLTMTHHKYHVNRVWNEFASNEMVCRDEIEPLLISVFGGSDATLICYGQTGTGKTYTLMGALEFISTRIVGYSIKIVFYEIHGKKCYDLLNNRRIIHLRSDDNDLVHLRGATSIELTNCQSDKILDVLRNALQLRSSEITERNPISSRSHAICSIEFLQNKSTSGSESPSLSTSTGAKFTLVDLAGSERNYETIQMTAQQHRESAQINLSLMALKDCFRGFHDKIENLLVTKKDQFQAVYTDHSQKIRSGSTVSIPSTGSSQSWDRLSATRLPYRASPLTRVLKSCFVNGFSHKTTIIATLSPSPIDLQHSLNTLHHVVMMSPSLEKEYEVVLLEVPIAGAPLSHVPISQWTADQVQAWLGSVDNGRFAHLVLPPGLDGQGLMELNHSSLAALCAGELRQARNEGEGSAWVIESDVSDGHHAIGRALWSALRREQAAALNTSNVQDFY